MKYFKLVGVTELGKVQLEKQTYKLTFPCYIQMGSAHEFEMENNSKRNTFDLEWFVYEEVDKSEILLFETL